MKVIVKKIKSYQSDERIPSWNKPYLKDINILEKCGTWKIQLTIAIKGTAMQIEEAL